MRVLHRSASPDRKLLPRPSLPPPPFDGSKTHGLIQHFKLLYCERRRWPNDIRVGELYPPDPLYDSSHGASRARPAPVRRVHTLKLTECSFVAKYPTLGPLGSDSKCSRSTSKVRSEPRTVGGFRYTQHDRVRIRLNRSAPDQRELSWLFRSPARSHEPASARVPFLPSPVSCGSPLHTHRFLAASGATPPLDSEPLASRSSQWGWLEAMAGLGHMPWRRTQQHLAPGRAALDV